MARKGSKQVSGIWLGVQLDTSAAEQEAQRLGTRFGTIAATMQKQLDGMLDPRKFAQSIISATRSLNEISNAAKAIERIDAGKFLKGNIAGLNPALHELGKSLNLTAKETSILFTEMARTDSVNQEVAAFKRLQAELGKTAEGTRMLSGVYKNLSADARKAFEEQAKTASVRQGRGVAGIFTPSSLSAGIQSGAAALGVSFGLYGAVSLAKSSVQATMKLESLDLAFQSIFGSSEKARVELDLIRETADELGLSFISSAEGAKVLFAAMKGTVGAKDMQQVFKSFSQAGVALKLDSEAMKSVLLAVSQMYSKGKISAEELRLQLSERLPGAVTLFAKSMGVSTKTLDEMLKKGEVGLEHMANFAKVVSQTFASGAANAAQGMQAQINRLSNAWLDLRTAFVSTQGSAEFIKTLTSAVKGLTSAAPAIATFVSELMKFGSFLAIAYPLGRALLSLRGFFAAVSGSLFTMSAASLAAGSALTKLTSIISSPMLIATGIAAAGYAVYNLLTYQTEGEKVMERYNASMISTGAGADIAADSIENLGLKSTKALNELLATKLASAQIDWKTITAPIQDLTIGEFGEISRPMGGGFFRSLEKMMSLGIGPNSAFKDSLVRDAANLGRTFIQEFEKAISEGVDTEEIIEKYKNIFSSVYASMKKAGFSEADLTTFQKAADAILGAADAQGLLNKQIAETSQRQEKLSKVEAFGINAQELEKAQAALSKFYGQVGGLIKTKDKIDSLASSYLVLSDAASKMVLMPRTSESLRNMDVLDKSLTAIAELLLKTKDGFNLFETAVRLAGGSASALDPLRDKMREISQIKITKGIDDLIQSMRSDVALKGAGGALSAATKQLQKYVEQGTDPSTIRKALESGEYSLLKFANGAEITTEQFASLVGQIKLTDEVLKKTSSGGVSAFKNMVSEINAKMKEWQSRIDESKSEEFQATLDKMLQRINNFSAGKKVTAEQKKQLAELSIQLAKTGADYKDFIDKTQFEKLSEEYGKFQRRISSEYAKTSGAEGADNIQLAREKRDEDLKSLEDFLQRKISLAKGNQEEIARIEEDGQAKIAQIRAIFRDAELRNSESIFDQVQVSIKDFYKKYGAMANGAGELMTNIMTTMSSSIADFALSSTSGFKSIGDAFRDMANTMIKAAMNMLANKAVARMFGLLDFDSGSSFSLSGTLSPVFKMFGISSAKGNAFSGGNLSAYSGSIVSSPTAFSFGSHKFALGAGLMGEAGPEAIMPLKRDSSGRLGITAQVGSTASQSIQIEQNLNFKVESGSTGSSGIDENTARAIGRQVKMATEMAINEWFVKQRRAGGQLAFGGV